MPTIFFLFVVPVFHAIRTVQSRIHIMTYILFVNNFLLIACRFLDVYGGALEHVR
jgi:hypothetical protein